MLVPAHLGKRVNPAFVVAIAGVGNIKVAPGAFMLYAAVTVDPEARLCDECAEKLASAVQNGSGKPGFVHLGSQVVPLLMSPTTAQTELARCEEARALERAERVQKIVALVERIRAGSQVAFARKMREGGELWTECTTHRNTPDGTCFDDESAHYGYANWHEMPSIRADNKVFGFCPTCAKEAKGAGVEFNGMMAALVAQVQNLPYTNPSDRGRSGNTALGHITTVDEASREIGARLTLAQKSDGQRDWVARNFEFGATGMGRKHRVTRKPVQLSPEEIERRRAERAKRKADEKRQQKKGGGGNKKKGR